MDHLSQETSPSFRYRWFIENCCQIQLPNGKNILIDPILLKEKSCCKNWVEESFVTGFSVDDIQQCDYILLTHVHLDHIGSLQEVWDKFHAPILVNGWCAYPLAKYLDMPVGAFIPMTDGCEYNFDDFRIKWLVGRHSAKSGAKRPSERKGDTEAERDFGSMGTLYNSNFIIYMQNGMRLAMDGGRFEPELLEAEKYRPNVILRHSERDLERTSNYMIQLFERSGAQFMLPLCHQVIGEQAADLVAMANRKLADVGHWGRVINPKPGQWIDFSLNCSVSE